MQLMETWCHGNGATAFLQRDTITLAPGRGGEDGLRDTPLGGEGVKTWTGKRTGRRQLDHTLHLCLCPFLWKEFSASLLEKGATW